MEDPKYNWSFVHNSSMLSKLNIHHEYCIDWNTRNEVTSRSLCISTEIPSQVHVRHEKLTLASFLFQNVSSLELINTFSGVLLAGHYHVGSLKSAIVGNSRIYNPGEDICQNVIALMCIKENGNFK